VVSISWSSPDSHVWTAGEVLTAANMNTYIRLNLDFLYSAPAARVHHTGAFGITTTFAKVTGLVFDYNVGGFTINTDTLVIPITGIYAVTYGCGSINGPSNAATAGMLQARLVDWNGVELSHAGLANAAAGYFNSVSGADQLSLAVNSVLALQLVCTAASQFADPANGNHMPCWISAALRSG
jgi:hypothetical protein